MPILILDILREVKGGFMSLRSNCSIESINNNFLTDSM